MKHYIVLAMIVVLFNHMALAQKVNIGFKAGFSSFSFYNSNGVDYNNETGFHAGMLAHIHISNHFAMQPELVYSEQGASSTEDGTTNNLHLGYINVPVLFQYILADRFRVEAGPQLGLMVKADLPVNGIIKDNRSLYHITDLSMGLGLGYLHKSTGLGIDARCNLGLLNINKDNSRHSYNRVFQLGIFYLFGTTK